jgi:hypothetical protein
MAAGTAAMVGGAALLGAASGAMGQKKSGGGSQQSWMELDPIGDQELRAQDISQDSLEKLYNLVGAGPGQESVVNAQGANSQLAEMLKQYAQGGFLPTEGDFNTANKFASQAFQGQQTALNQQFADQQTEAKRLAAQLNRPVNDPIIQAKLAQQQMQAQQQLSANQSSYATQFAQNLPSQRLGFQQDLASLQSNLATQAMANRQAILSMGSQIQAQGQNFRLNTAQRFGTSSSNESSGGGLGGAISGAMAMGSMGLDAARAFGVGQNTKNTAPSPAPAATPYYGTPTFGTNTGFNGSGMWR